MHICYDCYSTAAAGVEEFLDGTEESGEGKVLENECGEDYVGFVVEYFNVWGECGIEGVEFVELQCRNWICVVVVAHVRRSQNSITALRCDCKHCR